MLNQMESGSGSRSEAQRRADRIRILREELDELERSRVLELSTDQRTRFDEWSAARLRELATEYDVDTTVSQKRVSWGLRITSTLGGLALCAAVVLFFNRYWGYLPTSAQVAIVMRRMCRGGGFNPCRFGCSFPARCRIRPCCSSIAIGAICRLPRRSPS